MMPLLEVTDIETAYFDRLVALKGVSLRVDEGEVLAVLGPNGAGKTTLLRSIAGLLRNQPRKGVVAFAGQDVTRAGAARIARLGCGYVPDDRALFRELSVAENLEVALWRRQRREAEADLAAIVRLFPVLEERRSQQAETLSGGEQQMLALARALLRRPRLLLLDEPSLGLSRPAARAVFEALREIAGQGTAIVLVEQNAGLALGLARRAVVLDAGRIVLEGSSDDLRREDGIWRVCFGLGAPGGS
jgi:branched-chain amino acid transport system ATP-binding protein